MVRQYILGALFLSAFPATSALAAGGDSVSITAVQGEVKIGREGAWKAATVGATVGKNDYLTLAARATVDLRLPDGTISTIEGKTIVAGRRLAASGNKSSRAVAFSRAIRTAGEAVVGKDATFARGAMTREEDASNSAEDRAKLGARRGPSFLGEDTPKATEADFAETSLREGDSFQARNRALAIVEDPNDTPLEKRRAHLVLGQVAAAEGSFSKALELLDAAAGPPVEGEGDLATAYRAAALSQRGQVFVHLGNEARAKADFEAAARGAPGSAPAAQARFFLGMLAISQDDPETARRHFIELADYPELKLASDELLRAFEKS